MNPLERRRETLDRLGRMPLDLLVIGGGIVGAGVVRDAALRGLRAALVEQHDFAFGTSSRSSRLLHGGLRYLAQGRLRLVREASREKMLLGRIAPHLVEPLAFVFPTYRGGNWRRWQLGLGVKLYDLLCGRRNYGPSQSLSPEEVRRRLPGIETTGLTGSVRYFDALTNDARLVIDTLRSAADAGATLSNYTQFAAGRPASGRWRCEVLDRLTGQTLELSARVVVNAAGPWSDRLPQSSVRLRRTKGVHLVIDRARLPAPDAVVMTSGARILFAIPWGERVILGTTDTDYEGSLDDVPIDPQDVRSILDVAHGVFPQINLSSNDVLATWAGLRPLIDRGRGGPSDISRAHEIRSPQPGWIDVAGGKLTTYRRIGEQVVDHVLPQLGRTPAPCPTARQPLLPAERVGGVSGILPPAVSREAVVHFCREEWAVALTDVMLRRSGWGYYLPANDRNAAARQAASWMGPILGWDARRTAEEIAQFLRATEQP